MYFNEAWNANHTHGIPAIENGQEVGPRISIAFLLGAEDIVFEPKGANKTVPISEFL